MGNNMEEKKMSELSEKNANCAEDSSSFSMPQRKPGGLYRNVKVSVRTLNILIIIGFCALFLCAFFMIRHNGFTVTFDTDGGSYIESCKVLHGEKITVNEPPVKEGWSFTGWYLDRACTVRWDEENDTVTESITLYAGWTKKSD